MSVGSFSEWRKLPVSLTELCINTTLRCGQTFRWRKSSENEWSCALQGRVLSLRQDDPAVLYYRSYTSPSTTTQLPRGSPSNALPTKQETPDNEDTEALVRHYFNLEHNLSELYEQWAAADKNFKKKALQFTGIRILRQDAWEALISFICSSNNNIARISQMVEKLCVNYGPLIGHVDGQTYHDFPSPSALATPGVESRLRELGFGYRAKYIYRTAVIVANEREAGWLDTLRNPERPPFGKNASISGKITDQEIPGYREAHEKLLDLQGVGPKVADCVCLMGLGWGGAVPVDTHVWQIAQRDYKFGKGKQKSLTKATYDAIGDHFRKLWGEEAGWAHSVLFTADLKTFSDRLATKVEVSEEVTKPTRKKEAKIKMEDEEEEKKVTVTRTSVKRELSEGLDTKPSTVSKELDTVASTKRRRTRRG